MMIADLARLGTRLEEGQAELTGKLDRIIELLEQLVAAGEDQEQAGARRGHRMASI